MQAYVPVKVTYPLKQVRLQRSKGVHLGSSAAPASAEDIAHSMRDIGDFNTDVTYPTSPTDAIKSMMNTTSLLAGGEFLTFRVVCILTSR